MRYKIKNNILYKFLSYNYTFYKKNSSAKKILLVDRQRIEPIFANAMLALAISQKKKLDIVILTDEKRDSLITRIYKKLGFDQFLNVFSFSKIFKNFFISLKSLLYSFLCVINIFFKDFRWLINEYKVSNILIGDLIYDTNIRYYHRFKNPKLDLYFIKILFVTTFRFFIIKNYVLKNNIKIIVVGTQTGANNNGLSLRIANAYNIKSYCFFHAGKMGHQVDIIKKNYFYKGIGNLSKKDLKLISNISIAKINNFYKLRKKMLTKNLYTRDDYYIANKNSQSGKKFLNKLNKRRERKILFCAHAFADAPHYSGIDFIFNDYYHQMEQTIKFITKNDKKNLWIFRAHPNSRLLNEMEIFHRLVRKYKVNNILVSPKKMPIGKLTQICDAVVTGRGTVGLEFACEGKISILAGFAPYSDFKITKRAFSKQQYFKFLKSTDFKKKISNKKKLIARKILYVFENGFNFKTIRPQEYKKDKFISDYFNQIYKPNLSFNRLLINCHNFLKKDINNNLYFIKLKKLV